MRRAVIAFSTCLASLLGLAVAEAQQPQVVPAPDLYGNESDDAALWHVYGLRPGDMLNMRSGPGTQFRIILQLPEGTSVENLGCRERSGGFWCRVATTGYPRMSGWVNGKYIAEDWGPAYEPDYDDPYAPRGRWDDDRERPRRDAATPRQDRGDGFVPGTPYSGVGKIRCQFAGDPRLRLCQYGIVRNGPFAELDITFPDGFTRFLDYRAGRFRSKDGSETRSRKEGGVAIVTVNGTETYHVPDAVVMGD